MTRAEFDTESDIELSSALSTKKPAMKMPKSPMAGVLKLEPKKNSTKIMVLQALADLHTRKGVSLHAIKKYMEDKYQVETEKIGFYIKKFIKGAVQSGQIIQTKGIGASGSFKLAPPKKEEKKKKSEKSGKPVKDKPKGKEPEEKAPKEKKAKEKPAKMTKKDGVEKPKKPPKAAKVREEKKKTSEGKKQKKTEANDTQKTEKDEKKLTKKPKAAKTVMTRKVDKTPAKKKQGMQKRKSIGSIIKKPKMKPSKK